VLIAGSDDDDWRIDETASAVPRDKMRAQRGGPDGMIDRGPGYLEMLKQGAGLKGA
jgi:hypothetical protein